MSLKSERFDEMERIGQLVAAEIDTIESILARHRFFPDEKLSNYVLGYFRYKMGTKPLRAYSVWKYASYLLYEQLDDKAQYPQRLAKIDADALFSCKLPLVFELVITIQYLHNHILDEKMDNKISNHPKLCKTLLSSNILRELLFTYIDEAVAPLLEASVAVAFHKMIRDLLLKVDIGQRIDKTFNTYHYWKHPDELPAFDADAFLLDADTRTLMQPHIEKVLVDLKKGHPHTKVYFHRIYLTNVYFFKAMADMAAMLTQTTDTPAAKELTRFATLYGFMLQIINDYADFAYTPNAEERESLKTAGKKSTDFFADLYNFNVTLPLIYHLQQDSRRNIEAYLEGNRKRKKILTMYPRQVMQEIVASGAISNSIILSRDISRAAMSHIHSDNPITPYFNDMCDMAMNNKFYKIFK